MALLAKARSWLGDKIAGKPTSQAPGIFTGSFGGHVDNRLAQYRLRDMLYDNEQWLPSHRGGQLDAILRGELGKSEAMCKGVQIPGYLFPFARLVDGHQRILPGYWGEGIKIAPTFRGRPVHPALLDATKDPVGTTWGKSHLNTRKSSVLYMGPNYGAVGLRVVYEPADRPEDRCVSVHPFHPGTVAAYRKNLRGNLTYLRIESVEKDDDGTTHRIVETMDTESFSRTKDGDEQLRPEQRKNPFPWVPAVIIHHKVKTPDQEWGDHCYRGLERPVLGLNWSIAHLLRSADQYAFAQVFMAAEGNAPEKVVMGNNVVWYTKLTKEGPTPIAEMLVPPIDFAGALEVIRDCRQEIRNSYPLIAATELQDQANLSGESKRQSMLTVKSVLEAARPNYVDPLTRVLGMANSYGVLNSIPGYDFGTGIGTVEVADKAFGNGTGPACFNLLLDPVVAETPDDVIVNTTARYADATAKMAIAGDDLDAETRLELAQFDAKKTAELLAAQTDEPEVDEL